MQNGCVFREVCAGRKLARPGEFVVGSSPFGWADFLLPTWVNFIQIFSWNIFSGLHCVVPARGRDAHVCSAYTDPGLTTYNEGSQRASFTPLDLRGCL